MTLPCLSQPGSADSDHRSQVTGHTVTGHRSQVTGHTVTGHTVTGHTVTGHRSHDRFQTRLRGFVLLSSC
eukprot:2421067-Prymnesium_polylepis.1